LAKIPFGRDSLAMCVFTFSVVYLMALFVLLLVDHWLLTLLQSTPVMEFVAQV